MVAETPTDHQTPSFAPPAGVVVPIVPEFSAFDTHALDWVSKGWEVLPVSSDTARGKVLLAAGITGYGGEPWTINEVRQAIAGNLTYTRPDHPKGPTLVHPWQPNRNLALRMPPGVVGLDVDAYEGKTGGHTLRDLEDKAGVALPVTWVLTARDDGSKSGIRLFRIPPETKLADQTDIEMIQRHHRYAMATGSLHKTGRRVRLLRSDTWAESPVIPEPSELPLLPAAWVKLLKAKDQTREFVGVTIQPEEAVQAWLDDHPHGVGWTRSDAERAYERAWGAYGSRNTSQFVALAEALRAARDGKVSAADAIAWIAEAHHRACADDGSRAGRNDEEISRSVAKIVSKILGEQITLRPAVAPSVQPVAAVDVGSDVLALKWLQDTIGRGPLAGVFLKDGGLVHCVRFGEEGFKEISNGHQDFQQIIPMTAESLFAHVSTCGQAFGKWNAAKQQSVQVLFPREAATVAVRAPQSLPHVRTLRGVTTVPVIRPDGSVLSVAGYDDATQLLYAPEGGMENVAVPDVPTAEDMARARWWLDEVIGGFPFSTATDRVNYITYLMTPFLRIALPGPRKLVVLDARQPGTGKTLLATVAHLIHGGVMRGPLPQDEAELKKDISTILHTTSAPVVTFDNVDGVIRSAELASLLTSVEYSGRILGVTAQFQQTNDRIWSVTGNNITLGGDLPRRCLMVDIDAGVPNPQHRTGFKHNLHEFVPHHRAEIVSALLTLIRGWQAAGAPSQPAKGSDHYAEWIRVCNAIVAHAGYEGEVGDREGQIVGSTDDDEWEMLLAALYETFGPQKRFTARDVVSATMPYGNDTGITLPEDVLPIQVLEKRSQITAAARTLNWWMKNRRGRFAGAYRIVDAGKNRKGTAYWSVVKN